MFKWLNKQGVESDQGFVVQNVGRFATEYREGVNKVTVEVEYGRLDDGRLCVHINPNAFEHWDEDPLNVSLPLETQDQMLANFIAAKEFMGTAVLLDPTFSENTIPEDGQDSQEGEVEG